MRNAPRRRVRSRSEGSAPARSPCHSRAHGRARARPEPSFSSALPFDPPPDRETGHETPPERAVGEGRRLTRGMSSSSPSLALSAAIVRFLYGAIRAARLKLLEGGLERETGGGRAECGGRGVEFGEGKRDAQRSRKTAKSANFKFRLQTLGPNRRPKASPDRVHTVTSRGPTTRLDGEHERGRLEEAQGPGAQGAPRPARPRRACTDAESPRRSCSKRRARRSAARKMT